MVGGGIRGQEVSLVRNEAEEKRETRKREAERQRGCGREGEGERGRKREGEGVETVLEVSGPKLNLTSF